MVNIKIEGVIDNVKFTASGNEKKPRMFTKIELEIPKEEPTDKNKDLRGKDLDLEDIKANDLKMVELLLIRPKDEKNAGNLQYRLSIDNNDTERKKLKNSNILWSNFGEDSDKLLADTMPKINRINFVLLSDDDSDKPSISSTIVEILVLRKLPDDNDDQNTDQGSSAETSSNSTSSRRTDQSRGYKSPSSSSVETTT